MFYHRIRNLDRSNLSSFSYLLASTNTLTLPGPEVNMAARINQPKITFTKRSSILTATIISLLWVLVLIRQQRNRFQTQKWISGELWGALVSSGERVNTAREGHSQLPSKESSSVFFFCL